MPGPFEPERRQLRLHRFGETRGGRRPGLRKLAGIGAERLQRLAGRAFGGFQIACAGVDLSQQGLGLGQQRRQFVDGHAMLAGRIAQREQALLGLIQRAVAVIEIAQCALDRGLGLAGLDQGPAERRRSRIQSSGAIPALRSSRRSAAPRRATPRHRRLPPPTPRPARP